MKKHGFNIVLISTIVTLVFFCGIGFSLASSSGNYTLESSVISGGGGEAQSTNYFSEHTTGQAVIGISTTSLNELYQGFWFTLPPVVADYDGDGVPDDQDNCWDKPNTDQRDTNYPDDDNPVVNGDQHYGNACDPDFNNNGIVDIIDLNMWRQNVGNAVTPATEDVDINGDGVIWLQDLAVWRAYYGTPPGPGIGD